MLYWHTRLDKKQIVTFGAQRHVTNARVVGELRMNACKDNRLVFLHISDIHLNGEDLSSHQDVDHDIRNKLLEDLDAPDVDLLDGVNGVLITGDIAFKGEADEYRAATKWLKTLCDKVKCRHSHVWVVPGNHDVCQPSIKKSFIIQSLHDTVRKTAPPQDGLRKNLADPAAAQELLRALENYNSFADLYRCRTSPDEIAWSSRVTLDGEGDSSPAELVLNDGSELRLYGLNSTLISGPEDEDVGKPNQVVGLRQVQLREHPGIVNMTLCHHPFDWLMDGDDVQDYLLARARIQLFGHKHRQRALQIENSLVVGAGALHPDRQESDWEPRYNVIQLRIFHEDKRKLEALVYERAWVPEKTGFGRRAGSGDYPKRVVLDLPAWENTEKEVEPMAHENKSPPQVVAAAPITPVNDRDINYDFLELSYPKRMRLLTEKNLLEEGDADLNHGDLIEVVIKRARARGILNEFGQLVQRAKQEM